MYSYLIICESTISHFWISWGWEFIIFDERNIFLGPQGSTGTILVPAAIELVPLICLLPSPPRCCFLHLFCLRLEIFSTTTVVKVKKNFSDMLVERNRMRGDLGPRLRVPDSPLLRVFFLNFFFMGIGPCAPPPSSRVNFLSASSCCCVNYTQGCWVTRQSSYRSNRCASLFSSIRDRLGQTFLSLAGLVAHWDIEK